MVNQFNPYKPHDDCYQLMGVGQANFLVCKDRQLHILVLGRDSQLGKGNQIPEYHQIP